MIYHSKLSPGILPTFTRMGLSLRTVSGKQDRDCPAGMGQAKQPSTRGRFPVCDQRLLVWNSTRNMNQPVFTPTKKSRGSK